MKDIATVFVWLEGILLLWCLLTLIWGVLRGWEVELLMPLAVGLYGTAFLAAAFLAAVFIHDHVHIRLGAH